MVSQAPVLVLALYAGALTVLPRAPRQGDGMLSSRQPVVVKLMHMLCSPSGQQLLSCWVVVSAHPGYVRDIGGGGGGGSQRKEGGEGGASEGSPMGVSSLTKVNGRPAQWFEDQQQTKSLCERWPNLPNVCNQLTLPNVCAA